ncbi:MAG: flagellar hook assembly protein FlgD [Geminicoccaceae bacterium]|nr:flagellar hook assembly protein FlgD [Geminicoccaceae bacterium]MCX8101114.1 flagellar hook assembly protein FlgD [Geminicoccaceae bacterium]MDW8370199.1 flagellar hook assembly protein FlgD [Geminicoccaceae bacterium]
MPTSISTIAASATPPIGERAPGETGLASNFETFLRLLTTQLRNQDPLSPMDTERFTSQLVQFSSVEQALKTNRQLEQLVGLVRTSAAASALAVVGREVTVDGSRMLVDGQGGRALYTLAAPAASATVRIFDATGRLVHSTTGGTAAGLNRVDWDGKLLDGRRASPGTYRIAVTATDAAGRPVEVTFDRTTTVTGLESRDGGLVLVADGVALPPEAVRAVSARSA